MPPKNKKGNNTPSAPLALFSGTIPGDDELKDYVAAWKVKKAEYHRRGKDELDFYLDVEKDDMRDRVAAMQDRLKIALRRAPATR